MSTPYMARLYSWQVPYDAAVLETDRSQVVARIIVAQSALNLRLGEIKDDHRVPAEEIQAIIQAMRGLQTLRDGLL